VSGRVHRGRPADAGRRSPAGALVVLTGAAASCLVAATTPFTVAADVAVALSIALVAAVAVAHGRGAPWARRWRGAGAGRPALGAAAPWLVLVAAVMAWELFSLFAGPRATYPTISSIYDAVARWPAGKALIVFVWLALGWSLVRR